MSNLDLEINVYHASHLLRRPRMISFLSLLSSGLRSISLFHNIRQEERYTNIDGLLYDVSALMTGLPGLLLLLAMF